MVSWIKRGAHHGDTAANHGGHGGLLTTAGTAVLFNAKGGLMSPSQTPLCFFIIINIAYY